MFTQAITITTYAENTKMSKAITSLDDVAPSEFTLYIFISYEHSHTYTRSHTTKGNNANFLVTINGLSFMLEVYASHLKVTEAIIQHL